VIAMREIKVRVYDEYHKCYLTMADGTYLHDVWHLIEDDGFTVKPRYVFEMFTGLHDSKKVDIYCGDIITWNDSEVETGVVEWDKPDLCISVSTEIGFPTNYLCNIFDDCQPVTVIGNIHQHPELMEA